jgi:hypothetical protein
MINELEDVDEDIEWNARNDCRLKCGCHPGPVYV